MARYFCVAALGICLLLLLPTLALAQACTEPAPTPETQGFWHRVCLGIPTEQGGLRAGRGPTKPKTGDDLGLLTCVDGLLGDTSDQSACQEMDADPPSNPCERARKQRSAVLFNVCDGRIGDPCLDLSAHGCTSTSINDFIAELDGLINADTAQSCKQAAACAADLNEGLGVVSNCPCDGGDLCATNPCVDGEVGAGPGCSPPGGCVALGGVCCAFVQDNVPGCACTREEAECAIQPGGGQVCQ